MNYRKILAFCFLFSLMLGISYAQKKTAQSKTGAKSPTTTKSAEAKNAVDALKKNPKSKEEPVIVYNEDFVKGEELFQLNRPEKAIPYFEKSLESESVDPKVYVYLGICYYQIENYDKSLSICVQGLSKEGTDKKILAYNAGNSCYAMGNYMRADASYAIALKEDETYAPAVLNRANAQLKLDHLSDARQNYRKYLELEPNSPQRENIEVILRLLDAEIVRRENERPELINPDLFLENEKMEISETPEKVELDLPADDEKKSEAVADSEKVEIDIPVVAKNSEKVASEKVNDDLLASGTAQNQNQASPKELVKTEPIVPASSHSQKTAEKIEESKIAGEEPMPILSESAQSKTAKETAEKVASESSLVATQKNVAKIPPEYVDTDAVAPELPPDQLYLGENRAQGDGSKNQLASEKLRIDEELKKFEEERRQFEEEKRRLEEEKRAAEVEKMRLEEENKRKALEEELRLSEERRKKSEEEARLAEENRKKAAEEQERIAAEKRALEEERRNFEKAKLDAEIEAQRKALEEEKRRIEEQKLAMEAEQKRIAEENQKKAIEEELKKIEAARLAEEEQKRIAAENQKRALEEEIKKIEAAKLEEEKQRLAAERQKMEEEAKIAAQEAEKRRLEEEVASRVRAEEAEKARIAEEERKAEEARKAEEQKKASEEKRKAEIASWPKPQAELYVKGGDNFTPDGDGHNDTVTFVPSVKYLEKTPEKWELKILDPQGNAFRTITGSGNPPEKIEWDGKSDTGEAVLSKNTYTAKFSVTPSAADKARIGNTEVSSNEKIKTGLLLEVIVPGKEWKMVVNSINFVPNGALEANKLTTEQKEWNSQTLDEIAKQIKEHPGASIVIVDGYANNVSGTEKEEREELIPLSQMRANAIVEELVKRGVSRNLLQATGMGGANPLAEQSDRANWYKNRRVEFRIKK